MSDSTGTKSEHGDRDEQPQEIPQPDENHHAGAPDDRDAGKLSQLLRTPTKAVHMAATGVVAAKDSFVDFLTANDAGAQRFADAAARASAHIGDDLARGDLTADERTQRHAAEERILHSVGDNEKRARNANERAFALVTVAVLGLAGVAAATKAIRDGKA